MSHNESGDDQSEDGELRQSPVENKSKVESLYFSFSEEENDNIDALNIKPPQARTQYSGSKARKKESHDRSHYKKPERHRDEKHFPREKQHRDKVRSASDREVQRDKDRYYREKKPYESLSYTEGQYTSERSYQHRPEESRRHSDSRKHEDRKSKEIRHSKDFEKHRKDRYEGEKLERADKALQDLRQRLLNKRTKGEDDGYKEKREGHREKKVKDAGLEEALQGEAGHLVKEIISISSEDRRGKKGERTRGRDRMSEEERIEQEMRREKLLEAEREMARLKEQSRMERERRHVEKVSKRKQEEEENYTKRPKLEEQIVTVSDGSDVEVEESQYDQVEKTHHSEESKSSRESRRSGDSERSTNSDKQSRSSRSKSRERSKSRTQSRSRSRSASSVKSTSASPKNKEGRAEQPDSNHQENEEESTLRIDDNLPPYFPAIQGCRSVEEFQCLNRIEEGTYGVVYRAKDKRTEEIVALKRLKMEKEKEGFPITSLREINTLLKGQHPNIVTVREIVVGSNMDKIFIVMDYVEHDLKSLMETMRYKKQNFMPGEIKCLLKQLLKAVAHLHDNWILHRDLKTSNLLLSHKGILKVGDFGLAREYGSPLKAYTPIVVTLWYRAPELLLCTKEYSTPIDMWSVGCIFGELLLMNALFPGKSEVDQLNRVFKDLGTPTERIWPGFNELPAVKKMKFTDYPVSNLRAKFNTLSELGLSLLMKFLTFDPVQRVTAEEALKHDYFNESPLPIDPAMFPTWPAKSELGQKRALAASPKPPSGGGEYKKLGGDGDDDGYGFRIGMGIEGKRGGAGFSLKF